MSDKECRKDCDVYKDWLKAGERITGLEDDLQSERERIEDLEEINDSLVRHSNELEEALEKISQDLNSPAIHETTAEKERLAWMRAWKRLVIIATKALAKYKGE